MVKPSFNAKEEDFEEPFDDDVVTEDDLDDDEPAEG